jgi:hypothetical protein
VTIVGVVGMQNMRAGPLRDEIMYQERLKQLQQQQQQQQQDQGT